MEEVSVALGVPAGDDGLGFAPLNDGDVLELQTFGQGGTHVLVAVRAYGFGNRAFVSASLTNLTTGKVVYEPAPARPQLLYCGSEDACDLVPYLVHASGIAGPDEERHGLEVELAAQVQTQSYSDVAQASCRVVLSTDRL